MNNTPKYNVYVTTDTGAVRKNNEDSFAVNGTIKRPDDNRQNMRGLGFDEPLMCTVFDGMGGEAHGEVASETAALVAKSFYNFIAKDRKNIDDYINVFVNKCSQEIYTKLSCEKGSRGGCTFAMAYICDNKIKTYSVGDSRIYLYTDGTLKRISKDHTLAMKKYDANIYTWEEAESSNDSHKLTAYLGMDTSEKPLKPYAYDDIYLAEGDRLLICSDGLYDMCSEEEILSILRKDSDIISAKLANRAIDRGGVDNVTCIVIERTV